MWSFFKTFLATFLALLLSFFLLIFIIIVLVAGFQSSDLIPLHEKTVLKLTFDKPILEREKENPLANLDLPVSEVGNMGLIEIKQAIRTAKSDEKIKGIFLNLSSLQAGYATIEEIRKALLDFKTSGKFVYAYSETLSEGAYYLSTAADSIYLNPSGLLEFNGLKSEYLFFKGTLEKLDLKPEIFKVGDYKSAVEPLIFDKMSAASREQTLSFLQSIQNTMYANIANARKLPLATLQHIADSMLVHKPADAVRYGLADRLYYYDQVEDAIKNKLGVEKKEEIHFVGYEKYAGKVAEQEEADKEEKSKKNKIAVIVAQGDIVSGRGNEETIGSDQIAEVLRNARQDEEVKAIVLRINSPGGSSMASDVMWREVALAANAKPVIASMGDVAASGGYYMAMAADTIVAQPNTITGSIGVFGVLLNAQDFFKNKLGVTFDGVKTGKFSDVGTIARPLTDYERNIIQNEVEDIYTDFVKKAAQGRNMKYEDLAKVASGRVWTGEQAKKNGLVDVLGDFDKAIQLAAKAAQLGEDYEIEYLPRRKSFFERFFHETETAIDAFFTQSSATFALEKKYKLLIQKYNGIQARMPFEIQIQ
jgi:protease-4